jgi:Leucine-rich repeat (LRR) protein
MKFVTVGLKEEVSVALPEFKKQIRDVMAKCQVSGHLDLSLLGIREIPREALKLKGIKELRLDANQNFSFAERGVPAELDQLKHMSARSCMLTDIPSSISVLVKLQILEVQQNELIQLPASISRLKRLTVLNVENNHLSELPVGLGGLRDLVEIIADNNNMLALPSDIGQCETLEILSCARNRIQVFPSSICALKHLRKLNLEGNKLYNLPVSIGDMSLEVLRVGYNFIEWLPEDMFAGTLGKTIRHFSCPENNLLDLPVSLKDVPDTCLLEAEFNPLRSPPLYVLAEGVKVSPCFDIYCSAYLY